MTKAHDEYWAEYDGLQFVKHGLLSRYLGGWFPILSSFNGKVLYIDCHAGRGKHATGQEGSPILALNALLTHRLRDQILARSEVRYLFFEINTDNANALQGEIAKLGPLPDRMPINVFPEDYEKVLRGALDDLRNQGHNLAPSFAFVDPFGFTLSMDLLNSILSFSRCELLVNFMFRYVDMAIHRGDVMADTLNSLFGTDDWRTAQGIEDLQEREQFIITLFSRQLRARYVTHVNMRATNGSLKYVLLHASNHSKGREVMKEAMWKVLPDGTFTASERSNPNQLVFLVEEPDLTPLSSSLLKRYRGQKVRMTSIYDWLTDGLYLKKHLHMVLREEREAGRVEFSDYEGRFAFEKNPSVQFR